jgi:Arc/MetJ-type ribon-helix-helix transcriptional regulator
MSTKKVMVSFPTTFLDEVDAVAEEEHRSRSELLREAMRLYMEIRHSSTRPIDNPVIKRAVADQDSLSRAAPGTGEDSTAVIRHWRESRQGSQNSQ